MQSERRRPSTAAPQASRVGIGHVAAGVPAWMNCRHRMRMMRVHLSIHMSEITFRPIPAAADAETARGGCGFSAARRGHTIFRNMRCVALRCVGNKADRPSDAWAAARRGAARRGLRRRSESARRGTGSGPAEVSSCVFPKLSRERRPYTIQVAFAFGI